MVETVITVERTQTTQTTAPGTGGGVSALRINIGYFQTVPGIIKLVQFVSWIKKEIVLYALKFNSYVNIGTVVLAEIALSFLWRMENL